MFHSRKLYSRVNKLHERALRIVYQDHASSFTELFEKDTLTIIHNRNIQLLQSRAPYIANLLSFNENLDLQRKVNVVFGYFQQDNYRAEFFVRRLGTRLQFVYLISFHPNSLIS